MGYKPGKHRIASRFANSIVPGDVILDSSTAATNRKCARIEAKYGVLL